MSNVTENKQVGLLEAPGLILGNAIQATNAVSQTLVTILGKSDEVADALGCAAVDHALIVKDAAEAKRLIAQFEHKALIAEIEAKYKTSTGSKK